MFKKLLSTIKKEKTASSLGENLDTRLQEIPEVSDMQVLNNRIVGKQEDEQPFVLEPNQYSQLVSASLREDHNIKSINEVFYFTQFITSIDEQNLEDQIYAQPSSTWIQLPHSNRRLQKHGGDVTPQGLQNPKPLPLFLQSLAQKLFSSGISPYLANHVLLNEYEKGVGIMPHTDGPKYFPWVNSISLGSTCIFKFYKNMEDYRDKIVTKQLLLEPQSLVTFAGVAYQDWLHTIDDAVCDIINLQIDDVQSKEKIIVIKSNIDNFDLTEFNSLLLRKSLKQAIDSGIIQPLENDKDFNYYAELPRSKRISLTIRSA